MAGSVTIHDEAAPGLETNTFTLECPAERMTVRELIRSRIYQEAQEYNQKQPEYFRGLVMPSHAERAQNGYRLAPGRKIDWQEQYQKACEAFEHSGFFVLVGDRQAMRLDEEFDLKLQTEITFVKLQPLVGG